ERRPELFDCGIGHGASKRLVPGRALLRHGERRSRTRRFEAAGRTAEDPDVSLPSPLRLGPDDQVSVRPGKEFLRMIVAGDAAGIAGYLEGSAKHVVLEIRIDRTLHETGDGPLASNVPPRYQDAGADFVVALHRCSERDAPRRHCEATQARQ